MKFTDRSRAYRTAVVVLLAAVVGAASAQDAARPTIPPDVLQAATLFTAEQQRAVDGYADFYINQLVKGSDEQVVEARTQLIAPLDKGGTPDFIAQYAATVARRLAASAAMSSQPQPLTPDGDATRGGVIVRLNTMIVVSRLAKDDAVVSLILTGAKDEYPAVRYWAVRAVRGKSETLSPAQRQQLTTALQQMVAGEKVDEVVRVLLLALIELDAVDPVVNALNELVKLHVGNPRLTYDAKREAMRSLLQRLTVLSAQGQPVDPQFRQLARAACRYMILITQDAQGAELDEATAVDHAEMVRLSDEVLRLVHRQLGSTAAPPPSIQGALVNRNWQALQPTALTWREILKQSPFNFSDADLSPAGGD